MDNGFNLDVLLDIVANKLAAKLGDQLADKVAIQVAAKLAGEPTRNVGAVNESQAAKMLGVSVQLLRKWRAQGEGPDCSKMGTSVRYKIQDIERFFA